MGLIREYLSADLSGGVQLDDCILQLAERVESTLEDLDQLQRQLTTRVDQLEAAVKAYKQNLNEVDASVRQTWETLNRRVQDLERRLVVCR